MKKAASIFFINNYIANLKKIYLFPKGSSSDYIFIKGRRLKDRPKNIFVSLITSGKYQLEDSNDFYSLLKRQTNEYARK